MIAPGYRSVWVRVLFDLLPFVLFTISMLYLARQLSEARRLQIEAEAELVLLKQKCQRQSW